MLTIKVNMNNQLAKQMQRIAKIFIIKSILGFFEKLLFEQRVTKIETLTLFGTGLKIYVKCQGFANNPF